MPNILTPSVQTDYLTAEAYNHEELPLLIEKAERKVINRYRETDNRRDDLILDAHYGVDVRLDGYVEDEGQVDLEESDDGLIDALRATVAAIVEFWTDKPDASAHVDSMSQGDRSVSYRDKALPSSVYAPLQPYDERRRFHF